ncbi:hypothetical protein ACH5RR_015591, partial [Cinchona calisaya]
ALGGRFRILHPELVTQDRKVGGTWPNNALKDLDTTGNDKSRMKSADPQRNNSKQVKSWQPKQPNPSNIVHGSAVEPTAAIQVDLDKFSGVSMLVPSNDASLMSSIPNLVHSALDGEVAINPSSCGAGFSFSDVGHVPLVLVEYSRGMYQPWLIVDDFNFVSAFVEYLGMNAQNEANFAADILVHSGSLSKTSQIFSPSSYPATLKGILWLDKGYCAHCSKLRHVEVECRVLHPELDKTGGEKSSGGMDSDLAINLVPDAGKQSENFSASEATQVRLMINELTNESADMGSDQPMHDAQSNPLTTTCKVAQETRFELINAPKFCQVNLGKTNRPNWENIKPLTNFETMDRIDNIQSLCLQESVVDNQHAKFYSLKQLNLVQSLNDNDSLTDLDVVLRPAQPRHEITVDLLSFLDNLQHFNTTIENAISSNAIAVKNRAKKQYTVTHSMVTRQALRASLVNGPSILND